jgi:hypothetical protein
MEDLLKEIERFKQIILELGLPRQDYALFGLKCPYCGKSDRINPLESPEQMEDCPEEYQKLWLQFGAQGDPVLCKFCLQVLSFIKATNQVFPLEI